MNHIGKIINCKQLCYLTISSCVSVRTSVEILSTREVWRARKRRGAPNFPSVQYLDIRSAAAWTNCFIITLSKRSMQQNFIILYYCRARSKQYNVYVTIFFSLTVKLMFLSWNWEKVYSKMIVKSIFWCQKNINLRKSGYWEKTTLQRMISRHSPHSSRRWQQQQHSPLSLTIG